MTPTEAARIVDRVIAATKRPPLAAGRRDQRGARYRGQADGAPGNVYRHGEPKVGGYAAAITTVGIMTTPE